MTALVKNVPINQPLPGSSTEKLQKIVPVVIMHTPPKTFLVENNAIRANELLLAIRMRLSCDPIITKK